MSHTSQFFSHQQPRKKKDHQNHLGVGVLFLASTVQGTPPSSRLSLPAMAGSTISGEPYSTKAQVRMSSPMCLTRRITEVMSPYWENCASRAGGKSGEAAGGARRHILISRRFGKTYHASKVGRSLHRPKASPAKEKGANQKHEASSDRAGRASACCSGTMYVKRMPQTIIKILSDVVATNSCRRVHPSFLVSFSTTRPGPRRVVKVLETWRTN